MEYSRFDYLELPFGNINLEWKTDTVARTLLMFNQFQFATEMYKEYEFYTGYIDFKEYKDIIFANDPTMLIIARYYGVHNTAWKKSDYKAKGGKVNEIKIDNYKITYNNDFIKYEGEEYKSLDELPHKYIKFDKEWRKINPMEQLTGTFYPKKIKGIVEWYKQSILYQRESKPIIPDF